MERLTHERANGIKTGYWSPSKKQDLVDRLSEYEDTGLTPEQIRQIDDLICREMPGGSRTAGARHGERTCSGQAAGVEGQDAAYVFGRACMIDDHRVRQMAREYDMNYSTARQLLEGARDVPALRIGRRYREITGGEAGGQENAETVPGTEEGTGAD